MLLLGQFLESCKKTQINSIPKLEKPSDFPSNTRPYKPTACGLS